MRKFYIIIRLFLLAGIITGSILSATSQNKPAKRATVSTFDESVFSDPNVVDSYIDGSGKQVVVIKVPGVLPGKYKMPEARPTDAAVMLHNVPAYDWSFGCSATSAAMMAGYYDNNGYPEIYTGPANGGVAPMDNSVWGVTVINGETRSLCPLSATRQGLDGRAIKGHVDDYWIQSGSNAPDPYIGNWAQHDYGDCTGDFMKTNQSEYGNSDGSTTYVFYVGGSPFIGNEGSDGNYGLRLFFESRGAIVLGYYNQYIYGYQGNSQGFTFENYKEQIDAGRPVILQLAGHSVLGLGYDDASQTAYIHNTWDYGLSSLSWGGVYADMQHYGVSVMELFPLGNPILTLDPLLSEVGWQAGSVGFSVVSNKTWTVSENADWLSVSEEQGIGNGNITAMFIENQLAQPRSAQITVEVSQTKTGDLSNGFPESFEPLIWEDFSGNEIPEGWQVQGLGQSNWSVDNSAWAGGPAPCLRLNWEPSFIGTSRMATQNINTTGINAMTLMFKHAVDFYSNSFTIGVAISEDGGTNWQTIWSVPVSASIAPETVTLQINNEESRSQQLMFSFFFSGDSFDLNFWYMDNILLFENKTSETLTLVQQGHPSTTQLVAVAQGWSGISSYQNLADPDVENLMAPLGDEFEILLDTQNAYWPAGNLNTIINWNPYQGYIIKSGQVSTLPFSGLPVTNKILSLSQGWNLMPVLSSCEMNTATLFSAINDKLIVIKDVAGTGIYWPEQNINSLPTLSPGKSYFVKVTQSCSVSFAGCD